MADAPQGYHVVEIIRGEFGEPSKLWEELSEFQDALCQGSSVMAIVELSDLVGAIKGWLSKHHPSITLADLDKMAEITCRVFESGYRESR